MDERQELEIEVGWLVMLPENLCDLLATVRQCLDRVPVGYRLSAKVKYCIQYENDLPEVQICYTRPETDEEYRERVGKEQARSEESERKERELYEMLKAKFEGAK